MILYIYLKEGGFQIRYSLRWLYDADSDLKGGCRLNVYFSDFCFFGGMEKNMIKGVRGFPINIFCCLSLIYLW